MERKIGEIFTYKGKTYKILKAIDGCKGCAFYNQSCADITKKEHCSSSYRVDGISVIFKEINNMEIKNNQLTIDIPEGYEIDKENSTFECIKFKSKNITYEEICNNLFKEDWGYFTDSSGKIIEDGLLEETFAEPNNAPNKKQLERLLVLNQLMNIAYYYNSMSYITAGYYIGYDKLKDKYFVEYLNNSFAQAAEITILFMKAEDAQAVIDNPNFRSILDVLCK